MCVESTPQVHKWFNSGAKDRMTTWSIRAVIVPVWGQSAEDFFFTWSMRAVVMLVWWKGAEEIQLDLFRSGAQRQPRIVVGEQGLKKMIFWQFGNGGTVKMIVWQFGNCENERTNKSGCKAIPTKVIVLSFWNSRWHLTFYLFWTFLILLLGYSKSS